MAGALLAYQTSNGMAPEEFSKGLPITLTLNANTPQKIQLTSEELRGVISMVQAMWIDNKDNPQVLNITIPILGQAIRFPAFSQGVVPVFSIIPFEASFVTTGDGVTVPIILLNMPQPYFVWPAV